jgi:predicted nuclease of restriction endonuclease-like (RecB) superfamily
MDSKNKLPEKGDYTEVLKKIKEDIQQSQLKAAALVTQELTALYWRIGKMLSQKIMQEGWGAKTLEHLAKDLSSFFPGLSGFSLRNLQYMRKFAESYPDGISATPVAQIPWRHNIVLMEKLNPLGERLWYAQKAIENGWSRNMLVLWIESNLYKRQAKAINNFQATLPKPQSDLAAEILKDPYNFAFLSLEENYREKALEQGLVDHIQKFLLELGQGFAFVGRQVLLNINANDYYLDLLFYHLQLRCYIVIELKAGEFDPRDVGQIGFYLAAVDNLLKHPEDKATIGMLLCKTKDKVIAEWAVGASLKPIGIAEYGLNIVKSLPQELQEQLPTIEEIEAEFSKKED